jgi:23S rRNA pseudouridine1911/1915/1917 synthase
MSLSSNPAAPGASGDGVNRFDLDAVAEGEGGLRLDRFLAVRLPELSRARLQALVRDGRLTTALAGDAVRDPSRRVRPGERYALEVPPPEPADPAAEEGRALEVLFEDEHLLVLVKPAGLVVHPAPGHRGGTLVNALLAHCKGSLSGIGGVERPGIVHRLDREVSGVMVAAKHDRAHIGLAGQFSVHSVDRVYEGVVWGVPGAPSGTVDAPIGRHPADRLRMAVVRGTGGKRAVTHWRRLAAAGTRAARLEVRLETGRTHQIRVHLASRGHPLLGDRLYGRRLPPGAEPLALDRILLHARRLGFAHPVTGERLAFESPAPPLFDRILASLAPGSKLQPAPTGGGGR